MGKEDYYARGVLEQRTWLKMYERKANSYGWTNADKLREITKYMIDLRGEATHVENLCNGWKEFKWEMQRLIDNDITDTPYTVLAKIRMRPQKEDEDVQTFIDRVKKEMRVLPYVEKTAQADQISLTFLESLK